MATYEVTLEDGRTVGVNSDSGDESIIKRQANHQEISRIVVEQRAGYRTKRANWIGPSSPSLAVSVKKVQD